MTFVSIFDDDDAIVLRIMQARTGARDTRLGRDVALKILPPAFTADADRLARFEREARVLAALNHPHIGAIYGVEEQDGVRALVLELVEGQTLADRLRRGALPVREALTIARQLAEALDAAHEKGIIHRDLKPANITLTPTGTVKVLDFGLAKVAVEQTVASVSQAPTATMGGTHHGLILGTAAYMSPEQARGQAVDKRADIWAFGCVLYEMLTGRTPFGKTTIADSLAAIVDSEPDWARLPCPLAPAVRRLLELCLDKDPTRRCRDIADARPYIEDTLAGTPTAGLIRPSPGRAVGARRTALLIAGTAALVGVVGLAVWSAMRPPTARIERFAINPSGAEALAISGIDRNLAITPDGSRIVYVGNRGTQLLVRALDQLDPTVITAGSSLRTVFVAPDSQWVGFVDDNASLKRVAISGGPAVAVAQMGGGSVGATWAPDGTIIFATTTLDTGLQRVPATSGPVTVLTTPSREAGERDRVWPEMLPGRRAVLFTITSASGGLDRAQIAVLDLDIGTYKVLIRGGSHAHYVSSGHLVYTAAGVLRAVAFDLSRLEPRGAPVVVLPRVVTTPFGAGDFSVAEDGTLVYSDAGTTPPQTARTLVWVDRKGAEEPVPVPPRNYQVVRLAPDGTRVILGTLDEDLDLWSWSLAQKTLTRLTFDPAVDQSPVWMPDGRRLLFTSQRAGAPNLYLASADGTGTPERLSESPNPQLVTSVSPDGMWAVFQEGAGMSRDMMLLALDGSRRVQPFLQTAFEERNGTVSPDGRWVAYESDSSGRLEVYVRPFPNAHAGQWQVSTAGGTRPLWARYGQELFYVAADGAVTAVAVDMGSVWSAGSPTRLFGATTS